MLLLIWKEDIKLTENIIFKVSPELKKQLQEEAKEKGLTLSSYLKAIISERKK